MAVSTVFPATFAIGPTDRSHVGKQPVSGSWPTKHSEPTVPPPKVAVLIALHVNDALSAPGTFLLYDALSVRS
jgi:hypothetical protein